MQANIGSRWELNVLLQTGTQNAVSRKRLSSLGIDLSDLGTTLPRLREGRRGRGETGRRDLPLGPGEGRIAEKSGDPGPAVLDPEASQLHRGTRSAQTAKTTQKMQAFSFLNVMLYGKKS